MPDGLKCCAKKLHPTSIERRAYIYISLLTGYVQSMGKTMIANRKEILLGYQGAFENKLLSPDDPNDPYFRLYAEAGLDVLTRPDIQDELVNIARYRMAQNRESFPYLVNLTLRSINYDQLVRQDQDGDDSYPEEADTVDAWRTMLTDTIIPGDYYPQNMNLYNRSVQSNVDARYVIPKIWALMNPDRVARNPRILDLGSSRNHGLKRLALGNQYPFHQIDVLVSPYRRKRPLSDEIDEDKTARLNERFVQQTFGIGKSIGVDVMPIHYKGGNLWVKACSFYPGEFRNKDAVARFDAFDAAETSKVDFAQASCTDELEMRSALKSRRGFDMAFCSNMLYQMSEPEVAEAIRIAKNYLSPDGFLVTLDSADVDRRSLSGLKFPEQFYDNVHRPFGYKTSVLDMRSQEQGFQEIFRWKNGRCNLMIPNLGHAVVNAALSDAQRAPSSLAAV